MKPVAPCKNCEERHAYCHGNCDAYYEYRKQMNIYNEQKSALYNEADTFIIEGHIRRKKHHK